MTVILVNCYKEKEKKKEEIQKYINLFSAYGEIRIVNDETFNPDSDAEVFIISGSEKYVSQNEFEKRLFDFLRETEIPVIGICYGHQLIARAYGANVLMGERYIKKKYDKNPEFIEILNRDEIFDGLPELFPADESHKDYVVETEEFRENFEILASSGSCPIEAIKHKKKLIYGFQFHIERSGKEGEIIAKNFFRMAKNVK